MQIISIIPKTFSSNTYILKSKASAFVVDPSVAVDTIENTLEENGLTIKGILLTHGHFDHTTSIDTLRERFKVPTYIHSADACMLTDGHLNGFYTFFNRDCIHKPADLLFTDGEKIQLADEYITVMHTPGHSKGSSCFIMNVYFLFANPMKNEYLIVSFTVLMNLDCTANTYRRDKL